MKTIVKAAMLFASAMVMFSSCLKEQTSLEIEDIPGVAKVTGTLVIYEGTDYVDGAFVSLKKPAANTEITVQVQNSSFMGNSDGSTDYKAVTDENGFFEVVIPAVEAGVDFKIDAPAFVGVFNKVDDYKDGNVYVEKLSGVYSVDKTTYNVMPGGIKNVYLEYKHEEDTRSWFFETTVPLYVYVGKGYCLETEEKSADIKTGSYSYNGEVLPADDVVVYLDVTYNDPKFNGHTERLVKTSNHSGFIQFDIPAESVDDMDNGYVTLALNAKEHLGEEDFTYYTNVYNQKKGEYYEESCDILAGSYTWALVGSNCSDSYDFRFFIPIAKIIMCVNQVADDEGILARIDDDDENDAEYTRDYDYLMSNYAYEIASNWAYDKFQIED